MFAFTRLLRHKFFCCLGETSGIMRRDKENKKNRNKTKAHHEHPLPGEISPTQKKVNEDAHSQAEKDIAGDVEFAAHNKNDDLDEGETARLGEDNTDLV